MRTLLPLLVLLLTATAAQAGIPGMSKEEEIRLSCSICMGLVFAVALICSLGVLVFRWISRRNDRSAGPTRTTPPPGT